MIYMDLMMMDNGVKQKNGVGETSLLTGKPQNKKYSKLLVLKLKKIYRIGCFVRSIRSNHEYKINSLDVSINTDGYFKIDEVCVFFQGKWAEIIQTITLSEAEQQLGKKIIV